jgi:hypothetical protein
MVQSERQFLATVEGPKGTAEIFEVTLPSTDTIEVEYKVSFEGLEVGFPSLGEAHIQANELVGLE